MTIESQRGAIFLDRDGVINRNPPEQDYVKSWGEFYLLPQVPEAISLLTKNGWEVFVITNQRGVARGLMTAATINYIHNQLNQVLGAYHTSIREFYWCPHNYGECNCRKPEPGLIFSAAADHNLDLSRSWLIGDTETDKKCAINAGIPNIRIIPTDGSLYKAVEEILGRRHSSDAA
ncbi:MAG: HAD family hydrolase [Patescibacteria group bacterium]|nr:HAD family hydrolase [Patescibacteria group bacterium]